MRGKSKGPFGSLRPKLLRTWPTQSTTNMGKFTEASKSHKEISNGICLPKDRSHISYHVWQDTSLHLRYLLNITHSQQRHHIVVLVVLKAFFHHDWKTKGLNGWEWLRMGERMVWTSSGISQGLHSTLPESESDLSILLVVVQVVVYYY